MEPHSSSSSAPPPIAAQQTIQHGRTDSIQCGLGPVVCGPPPLPDGRQGLRPHGSLGLWKLHGRLEVQCPSPRAPTGHPMIMSHSASHASPLALAGALLAYSPKGLPGGLVGRARRGAAGRDVPAMEGGQGRRQGSDAVGRSAEPPARPGDDCPCRRRLFWCGWRAAALLTQLSLAAASPGHRPPGSEARCRRPRLQARLGRRRSAHSRTSREAWR